MAVALYLLTIVFLKRWMANEKPMRLTPVVVTWNFALSLFSAAGVLYCVPHFLFNEEVGVLTAGFYPSVCSEPRRALAT